MRAERQLTRFGLLYEAQNTAGNEQEKIEKKLKKVANYFAITNNSIIFAM